LEDLIRKGFLFFLTNEFLLKNMNKKNYLKNNRNNIKINHYIFFAFTNFSFLMEKDIESLSTSQQWDEDLHPNQSFCNKTKCFH